MAKLRRGRREKNSPKVPLKHLQHALAKIMERHGVSFASPASEKVWEQYWLLYKDLLMLAPTMAILTKSPISIYGVGSFKVDKGLKLRARYSPLVSRFIASGYEPSGDFEEDFWQVFKEISKASGIDASVLEAKLSIGGDS